MTSTSIILVIVAYFLLLILVSYFTGKSSDNQTFFLANKNSPWYLVAFGMIGASLSGVTFISIPGVIGNLESVNGQYAYMQMVFGYLLGYAIIALVLLPLYYRLQLTSIYSYLESRFGFWSYKVGAFYFLLSRTIGASFRLFLVAIVLQQLVSDPLGVPFPVTILVTLLLIWVYTFRSGIKTIVWTDSLQTLFMLIAVGFSIYFIADALELGFSGLITTIQESQYSQLFFFEDSNANNYFFKQFFSGAAIAVVMTGLDQDMMQKNLSCRNLKEAQKNIFAFSIVLVLVNFLFVSLGALLYIYAANQGIDLPEKTDLIFSTLAMNHFPIWAGIVFLIGLIAAAYSSADSALTSLTTSFCIDFLDFEKKENTSEKSLIQTRYAVHITFTVILFFVILIFNYVLEREVISELFKVAGYTYGPLLGLYAFGLFTNYKIRDQFVPLVCLLSPIICYVLNLKSAEWLNGYQFGFEILILNGALTFIGLICLMKND